MIRLSTPPGGSVSSARRALQRSNDFTPSLLEDESTGETILYLSSNRPGGPGGTDIYSSLLESSGTFGPARIEWDLSTASDDQRPNVRKDGLEIVFDSNRSGSLDGSADLLWTSTRASTSDPWSAPSSLGAVNSTAAEGRPYLSFDRLTLYFMSSRAGGSGGLDLYSVTRTRDAGGHPDPRGIRLRPARPCSAGELDIPWNCGLDRAPHAGRNVKQSTPSANQSAAYTTL